MVVVVVVVASLILIFLLQRDFPPAPVLVPVLTFFGSSAPPLAKKKRYSLIPSPLFLSNISLASVFCPSWPRRIWAAWRWVTGRIFCQQLRELEAGDFRGVVSGRKEAVYLVARGSRRPVEAKSTPLGRRQLRRNNNCSSALCAKHTIAQTRRRILIMKVSARGKVQAD